jgi:hypothetical protein
MWDTIKRLTGRPTGERTMENDLQSARARLVEIEAQWAALTERIQDGSASPQDYEDRPGLLSRVQAAREALEAVEGRVRRAAQQTTEEDFRRRVDEAMDELADVWPRMLFTLTDIEQLWQEAHNVPFKRGSAPASVGALFNDLPNGFATTMLRTMREVGAGMDWDYASAAPEVIRAKSARPVRRTDNRVVQVGKAELPPGASGIVNSFTGEVHVGGLP